MSAAADTWIVVADGERARVFEERRRLAELRERTDLAITSHQDRRAEPGRAGALSHHARHGGRANGPSDPARRAEERFLHALARRIDAAASTGAFARLVILAPPLALGVLRQALRPATASLIEVCDPHERGDLDADAVRARLRDIRAQA